MLSINIKQLHYFHKNLHSFRLKVSIWLKTLSRLHKSHKGVLMRKFRLFPVCGRLGIDILHREIFASPTAYSVCRLTSKYNTHWKINMERQWDATSAPRTKTKDSLTDVYVALTILQRLWRSRWGVNCAVIEWVTWREEICVRNQERELRN